LWWDVLALVAKGMPATVIAAELGIAERTARNYIREILLMLRCRTQLEALAKLARLAERAVAPEQVVAGSPERTACLGQDEIEVARGCDPLLRPDPLRHRVLAGVGAGVEVHRIGLVRPADPVGVVDVRLPLPGVPLDREHGAAGVPARLWAPKSRSWSSFSGTVPSANSVAAKNAQTIRLCAPGCVRSQRRSSAADTPTLSRPTALPGMRPAPSKIDRRRSALLRHRRS
jgi:hypothetical protein